MSTAVKPLQAFVTGIGLIAPGLPDWTSAAAVLRGETPHTPAPTVLPVPELLPIGRDLRDRLRVAADGGRG